jgi:hypothetical protein
LDAISAASSLRSYDYEGIESLSYYLARYNCL